MKFKSISLALLVTAFSFAQAEEATEPTCTEETCAVAQTQETTEQTRKATEVATEAAEQAAQEAATTTETAAE